MYTVFCTGGRSQVVTAMGCGSIIRGFKSRRSPLVFDWLNYLFRVRGFDVLFFECYNVICLLCIKS